MVELTYFKGRGRAESTRWMLAINQIQFTNVQVTTPQELASLRLTGKLPFDQMPLLEINGLCLSQSAAMIRYLARLGEFYGDNDQDAMMCDMFAGAVADFAETGLQAAFQPTAEVAITNLNDKCQKFGPKFEAHLAANGNGVCAGSRLSLADVVLAEALSGYLEWCPAILETTPHIKALNERVVDQPGIAKYLKSTQRYPKPAIEYVVDVARVLQRALPGHMADANQFILTTS